MMKSGVTTPALFSVGPTSPCHVAGGLGSAQVEKELRRVGATLPGIVRRGLAAVDPGGSISVLVTATRTVDADANVRIQVWLTSTDPVECESLLAQMTGPMRGPSAKGAELDEPDRAFICRVLGQIVIHLDHDGFDVGRLARALHTSPSQLRRRLRALIDRSPAELIRLVRLLRARQLMADDRLSLSSIAHACGFSDQAHFTRTYRRYFGSTPSAGRGSLG